MFTWNQGDSDMIERTISTPIGDLRLVGTADALCEVHLTPGVQGGCDARPSRALDETERQLAEYFGGERTQFDLPLDLAGTEFQREVWAALQTVEFGQTCSYLDIARKLGRDASSCRAIGQANGKNPVPVIVPCHRVIAADRTLGGYSGGLDLKRRLLAHEGVHAV